MLRWRDLLEKYGFYVVFAGLTIAQIAPLFASKYLPFHDLGGMVGLTGALTHRNDPAARIGDFYEINIRAYPSTFFMMWVWLLAKLHLSVAFATSLYYAIFILAALPASVWAACWAFGRPRWLSLLAFPVVWHHQVWWGFIGSASAIPGLLCALAAARRMTIKPSWGAGVALALAALYTAMCHAIAFIMLLGILAPFVIVNVPWRDAARAARTLGVRIACMLPSLVFLGPWLLDFTRLAPGHAADPRSVVLGGDGGSRWQHFKHTLVFAEGSLKWNLSLFLEWLGDGLKNNVDRWIACIGLIALFLCLVIGVRIPADTEEQPRGGAGWLVWAAVVLLAGFLLLPMHMFWPTDWWGARARFVVPLFLVGIVAVRPWRYGLSARWAAIPALASLFYGIYLTHNFVVDWKQQVAGFGGAIRSIPPGQSVLYMSNLPTGTLNGQHVYLGQYYTALSGGFIVPCMKGHREAMWVLAKSLPQHPPWGNLAYFRWPQHSAAFNYFLVENAPPTLFHDAPKGAVTKVFEGGHWSVWHKEESPNPHLPVP